MRFFTGLFSVFLLFSCADQQDEPQRKFEDLREQTMELHDEVMPKMSQLMSLRSKLLKIKDSTNTDPVEQVRVDLADAHKGMMEWMADFSDKFPHGKTVTAEEIAEKMPLLEEEFQEIKTLKQETEAVIETAEKLIDTAN